MHPGKLAGQAASHAPGDSASSHQDPSHDHQQPTDVKQLFRFQGQFEPTNNPELAAVDQQIGVHRPKTVTPADAHSAEQVAPPSHAPLTFSTNPELLSNANASSPDQPGAADALLPTSASSAALQQQPHQSEFRRSHSPEWYDAKFRSYQLR